LQSGEPRSRRAGSAHCRSLSALRRGAACPQTRQPRAHLGAGDGGGICYLPANLLPIMKVTSLGNSQADTILSGVIYLTVHGMWPLALVVFIASVFVPLAKMIILVSLLISVQRRSQWRPVDRTRLYRITEAWGAGPWSIFVVTIWWRW
jgi:uncharacterized paraquat-inducible protein A